MLRSILIFAGFYRESEGDLLGDMDGLCGVALLKDVTGDKTAVAASAAFPYVFAQDHIRCAAGRTVHGNTSFCSA